MSASMEKQEQFDALCKCAKYLSLYERRAPGLEVRSENLYQFFAKELITAAYDPEAKEMIEAITQVYPDVMRNIEAMPALDRLITYGGEKYCAQLTALVERLTTGVLPPHSH